MPKNEENEGADERPALDILAEELRWKAEHLDPSDDRPWAELDDRERGHYRTLVGWLLMFPEELHRAIREGLDGPADYNRV